MSEQTKKVEPFDASCPICVALAEEGSVFPTPTCEHCGAVEGLILLACSGGASGDIWACAEAYAEHLAPWSFDGVKGCEDCSGRDAAGCPQDMKQ